MIKFHDPRADMEIPLQSYELGIDLDSCNEPTIGLLANGFPDSERFLEFIAQAIARKFPNIRFKAFNKGNASIKAPDTLLEDIVSSSLAVVTAYGH